MLAYFVVLTIIGLFGMIGESDSRKTLPFSLVAIVGMILTLVVRWLS